MEFWLLLIALCVIAVLALLHVGACEIHGEQRRQIATLDGSLQAAYQREDELRRRSRRHADEVAALTSQLDDLKARIATAADALAGKIPCAEEEE